MGRWWLHYYWLIVGNNCWWWLIIVDVVSWWLGNVGWQWLVNGWLSDYGQIAWMNLTLENYVLGNFLLVHFCLGTRVENREGTLTGPLLTAPLSQKYLIASGGLVVPNSHECGHGYSKQQRRSNEYQWIRSHTFQSSVVLCCFQATVQELHQLKTTKYKIEMGPAMICSNPRRLKVRNTEDGISSSLSDEPWTSSWFRFISYVWASINNKQGLVIHG